jgi:hypothetical protein
MSIVSPRETRQSGILVTLLLLPGLTAQMFLPSNASPLPPTEYVLTTAPVLARSFVTMPLFPTKMLVPSKARAAGSPPPME